MSTQNSTLKWSTSAAITKRLLDLLLSFFALVLLSPLFILLIVLVGITAGLPVFHQQERVGKHGKTFQIYKLRTMKRDAEENGPQLSHEGDERIVGIGKILRKWRIDELPQFVNVLKGEMSIVGPRPERQYYVDQLLNTVTDYDILFNVRPGITSSGMVNFGYASTIEEMQERAPYDIEYVKNLSLKQDFQILRQTVMVVFEGSGK